MERFSENNLDGYNLAKLEKFYLARLIRFAHLAASPQLCHIPQWRRLARRATLSAYRDCISIDLEKKAREIIGEALTKLSP